MRANTEFRDVTPPRRDRQQTSTVVREIEKLARQGRVMITQHGKALRVFGPEMDVIVAALLRNGRGHRSAYSVFVFILPYRPLPAPSQLSGILVFCPIFRTDGFGKTGIEAPSFYPPSAGKTSHKL